MQILKNIILSAFFLTPALIFSQTAHLVNNGAKIVVQNGANVVVLGSYTAARDNNSDGQLDLDGIVRISGDFTNNSQANALSNSDTDGEIIFNGVGNQTVSGTYNSTFVFEKITINNGSILLFDNIPAIIAGTATLNGTNTRIQIGTQDLALNGNLMGAGLVKAVSNGSLLMTAATNTNKVFPVTDGTNNYSVTVNCNQPTTLKIRLVENATALSDYICDINHIGAVPAGFNASMIMRLDKSVLTGGILPVSFKMKNDAIRIPENRYSVVDKVSYYEITTTNISSF